MIDKNINVTRKMNEYGCNHLIASEFYILINISDDKEFIRTMDILKNKNIEKFNQKFELYKLQFDNKNTKYIESKSDDERPQVKYIPKCPTCSSPDIKKISSTKRWFSTGLFGIASSDVGKTMQCNNCGYKW